MAGHDHLTQPSRAWTTSRRRASTLPRSSSCHPPSRRWACPPRSSAGSPPVASTIRFPSRPPRCPTPSRGRDVCGRAPTGSGKTLAFGIPLVARRPPRRYDVHTVSCSCPPGSSPRRSRASCALIAGTGGPSVSAVYGGVAFAQQIDGSRPRRRHRRRLPGPARRPDQPAPRRTSTPSRWWSSTRPTAWPTWASSTR